MGGGYRAWRGICMISIREDGDEDESSGEQIIV